MHTCSRRSLFAALSSLLTFFASRAGAQGAASSEHQKFVTAAFNMKAVAVTAGDQPYGAVVVKNDKIIGNGPSRVLQKKDWNAHAERDGTIKKIRVKPGDSVAVDAVIMEFA